MPPLAPSILRRLLPALALSAFLSPAAAQAPHASVASHVDEAGLTVAYGYEVTLERNDSPPVIALIVRTAAPREEIDVHPPGSDWATVSPAQASFLTDLVAIPEDPEEMEPRTDLVGWASRRAPRLEMTTEDRLRFRLHSRDWLPGLTDAWLVGRPAEGLQIAPGRPLQGAQTKRPAVGPVIPAASVEEAQGTLETLLVQQAEACVVGWIRTTDRCDELGWTMERLARSLEAGDGNGFQQVGRPLVEELERAAAGEDPAIEPMAAEIFLFYLERLGQQAADVLTRG